ncbi:hypothetical protein FK529_03140 [Tsukamurella asaccharolytica]|uniref:DUF5642 domain-containing protein n=1 Tax=Tsukamurella asaccharolytica TaxID=2592067 RepID=A0A5C5RB64_9ACTN|nr:DUF5642 family protein [Tsukamurella asaccharolytica]TWS20367.1 hypothetical protein FK529_03140 [Tsukamurella asaccharolytica]
MLNSDNDDQLKSATFTPQKVESIVSKFPVGTHVAKSEKTLGQADVTALAASDEAVVTPSTCQGKQKFNSQRLLGAKISTVNAQIEGVRYSINAQQIPSSNASRTPRDQACERMSLAYGDGSYSIISPAESPKVAGVDTVATRTTTRTVAKETVDNFTFAAWTDDYHAVVVLATSDPSYKPQANPIDPTFAKELLSEAVRLVTTT